jgi:hypothetical protein
MYIFMLLKKLSYVFCRMSYQFRIDFLVPEADYCFYLHLGLSVKLNIVRNVPFTTVSKIIVFTFIVAFSNQHVLSL